jgi:hypothetical protein
MKVKAAHNRSDGTATAGGAPQSLRQPIGCGAATSDNRAILNPVSCGTAPDSGRSDSGVQSIGLTSDIARRTVRQRRGR